MRITITNAMEAKALMERPEGALRPNKIISLVGPYLKYELECHGEHHYLRIFHDFEGEIGVAELHGTEWETEEIIMPTYEGMVELLEWSKDDLHDEDWLLIHCHAGRSRSAAALIAILVQQGSTPDEAVNYVGALRSIMLPNRLMTKWFDNILKQDGKLIKAVQR